jgi:hypothetical protein
MSDREDVQEENIGSPEWFRKNRVPYDHIELKKKDINRALKLLIAYYNQRHHGKGKYWQDYFDEHLRVVLHYCGCMDGKTKEGVYTSSSAKTYFSN